MRAQFKLPSVIGEEMEGRRPIKINFEIPYFTTSGIQVSFVGSSININFIVAGSLLENYRKKWLSSTSMGQVDNNPHCPQ